MAPYLPVIFFFDNSSSPPVPSCTAEYFGWQREIARRGGLLGAPCWIVQTYLVLRERGFDCQLATKIPDEGIVIAHYDHIPRTFQPSPRRYWVCIQADRLAPHPYVHFHVLQNPTQHLRAAQPYCYIPHWPQPGLIRREELRGDQIKTLRFFGEREHLAPELAGKDFRRWCAEQGLDFQDVPRDKWHDYSNCDVVVAIRSLGSSSWWHDRPPTKLVNAWLAGTPAILGRESAFRVEGRVGEDYLEATHIDDVRRHIMSLMGNHETVRRLIVNGTRQATRLNPTAVALRWEATIENEIQPRAASWARAGRARRLAQRVAGRFREGLAWRGVLMKSTFRR